MENLLEVVPSPVFVEYLSPVDAINLGRTCKKMDSQLLLSATTPRLILSLCRYFRRDRNNDRRYGFPIPITSQVTVHKVKLSMDWYRTYEHNEGRVFVVARDKNETFDGSSRQDFSEGSVIYASNIAPNDPSDPAELSITFIPRKNKTYHLWYLVGRRGRGGGHLILHSITVQALVSDDESRCFAKADDFVIRSNDDASDPWDTLTSQTSQDELMDKYKHAMRVYMETILASTSYSLAHGLQIPPPTVEFFRESGISVTLTQKLVETIVAIRRERAREFARYRQNIVIGEFFLDDSSEESSSFFSSDESDDESL